MELQFSNSAIIIETLSQIKKAIKQLLDWNNGITSYEEYLSSQEGTKVLAVNCMLLEAIGEGIKEIDRKTNKSLLILRPEIPWTEKNMLLSVTDKIMIRKRALIEKVNDELKNIAQIENLDAIPLNEI